MNRTWPSALAACALLSSPVVAHDDVFDSNGVKIRYVTEGEGEAVVLIHGWMADSSMWGRDSKGRTKLDTSKTQGFRLIALDCRGHGKSDKPREPEAYGPEVAEDVVRLLDHLGIQEAHLIGYSSGVFVAGRVAATHPERVLSLICAGQAPVLEGWKPSDFSETEVLAKAFEDGDLGAYILAVTPANRPRPTPEQAKVMAGLMFAGKDVEAFVLAGRGFPSLAVSLEQLGACAAPILFVRGENESEHVKGRIASVQQQLGRGELVIVPGSDHITTLARPEFSAALRTFLEAHRTHR